MLVEAIIGIRGKSVFKERAYSCQWTTDFLASGSHFFLSFSETPASDSFFPPGRNDVSRKSFISVSGNGF